MGPNIVTKIFPFLGWFENYGLRSLRVDALAGLTVALVLIPQSMAYAQLAGLPPHYGLYAAFLPPIVASLFGSSRQLATGPAAVFSILTAASLAPLARAGGEGYIAYAILLALMVGVFQLALGLLKLGIVVNFISHPVVNGFTNGVAIVIATSQLSKMFGVHADSGEHHYETILRVVESAISYTHWPTFLLGAFAFAIMYVLKRLDPRIPYVLVAVVATTLVSWTIGFQNNYAVPITKVESAATKKLIKELNATVLEIISLADRHTDVSTKILAAENHKNIARGDVLRLRHDIALNELESEKLEKKAFFFRKELRALKFFAVADGNGELRFRLVDGVRRSRAGDGRIWRIGVGGNPLDENDLTFIGGGEVVGSIPKGLPHFSTPKLNGRLILSLLPYVAIISLLGFMEAISIAKAMAARTGQSIDPNQELIGQGLANISSAMSGSFPVAGSFSRSALNFQAGAISGLSSLFTSLTVIVVLFFFTSFLHHLPQSVLAAIIMMAVLSLVNISGVVHAWKAYWCDGVISIITFVGTLAFAPHLDRGIIVGVALSILVFLYKSMRPRVAILSKCPDDSYHDACNHGLQLCDYIAMLRFDGPLFFANASYLEDQVAKLRLTMPKLNHIIIVAIGIDEMDATGEEALSLTVDRLRSAGYDMSLSGVKQNVLDVMKRTHLYEKIGSDHFFSTQASAVASIHEQAHRDTEEKECPLLTCCPLPKELL